MSNPTAIYKRMYVNSLPDSDFNNIFPNDSK